MNYLEMCNEVLVRMREDEITDVASPSNDSQQKLVCKFVNDAKQFVEKSHDWNGLRKMWIIDPAHEVYKYKLTGASEQSRIYMVRWMNGAMLRETDQRHLESKPPGNGVPYWYSLSAVQDKSVVLRLWPYPDYTFSDSFDIYEYGEAFLDTEYNVESITATPDRTLMVYGYAFSDRLTKNEDQFLIPEDPILQYALAYSARERGEAGGASSMELFALAKQYLSDAISWDVANASLEYLWDVG